jgi:signal transduction histidine kinase
MNRRLNRLGSRLFFSHLLVAAVALLAVGLILVTAIAPFQRDLIYARLTDLVLPGVIVARSAPPLDRGPDAGNQPPLERLPALLRDQAVTQEIRLLVVDGDGRTVRFDSADALTDTVWTAPLEAAPPHRFAILRRLSAAAGIARGTTQLDGEDWLYVAAPLRTRDAATSLYLVALTPRPSFGESFRPVVLVQLAALVLLLAILIGLLSAWLTHMVTANLAPVLTGTQAIARGEYNHRVEVGLDALAETTALAAGFNHMAAQVQRSRQAQRDFVANVGHDLKTPLTSIHGFAQALADGTAADPALQQRAVAVIQQEAARLGSLVEELLELARLDSDRLHLRRSSVDVGALLTDIVAIYSPHAQAKQVTLAWTPPPSPLVLAADGDRLSRVVTNLLDNALAHTPPHGTITLSAQRRGHGDHAGWVEIAVQDMGAGIPAADLPFVFERFYQVDKARSARRGSGLGLAIVAELVAAHGGQVGVESAVGAGSRFWVHLPPAAPPA